MDDGGRLAQSLSLRFGGIAEAVADWRARRAAQRRLRGFTIPRGIGSSAALLFLLSCGATGYFVGGHHDALLRDNGTIKDFVATSLGFGVRHVAISGNTELSEAEVTHLAGISARASLPFLDPAVVQAKLVGVPLIAEAQVTKLYPDRIAIAIKERVPFAIWQLDGHVQVISLDGTAIETLSDPRFLRLPHVVGPDANKRVREFVALVESVPEFRDQIRAGILISSRRWTLKLQNGVEVKLPELGAETALKAFAALERAEGITRKAVLAVDLRLPDRITVRLTEEAAAAHAEIIQQKIKKWGGKAS
jgi:cell division protein FtsQ